MRHRLEDIGRIHEKIDRLLEHEVFDGINTQYRLKDSWEWFNSLSIDLQEDQVTRRTYGLEELERELYEILEICKGQDVLNESDGHT